MFGMVSYMVLHKRCYEEVTVVVTLQIKQQ